MGTGELVQADRIVNASSSEIRSQCKRIKHPYVRTVVVTIRLVVGWLCAQSWSHLSSKGGFILMLCLSFKSSSPPILPKLVIPFPLKINVDILIYPFVFVVKIAIFRLGFLPAVTEWRHATLPWGQHTIFTTDFRIVVISPWI